MSRLESYLRHHPAVPGWLDGYSARFIVALSHLQKERGATGSVGEIGVHMGRLFILLKLLAGNGERAIAIDIFGDQHLNVDRSGFGNREQFIANLDRHASGDGVVILQSSSMTLAPDDILSKVGPCRLFSVDGGHTAECTMNDLMIAEQVLAPGGVVILDDFFNPAWPDVATGAAAYFQNAKTTLRPFAITPNKLFLTRPADHAGYLGSMMRRERDFHDKDSRMFGFAVGVFGVDPASHGLARAAKRWLRDSPIGPPLLVARRRLRLTAGR